MPRALPPWEAQGRIIEGKDDFLDEWVSSSPTTISQPQPAACSVLFGIYRDPRQYLLERCQIDFARQPDQELTSSTCDSEYSERTEQAYLWS